MLLSLKHLNWASIFPRGYRPLGIGGLVIAVIAPMAFCATIGIHSTGSGLEPGELDPNYTLTVNALGNGTSTYVAEGLAQTGWPLNGTWATDPPAAWIAPQANVVDIPGTGSDTHYVYTTTFNLTTGFDPATANLTGYWTADNYIGQVQLNGQTVFSSNSCMSPDAQGGFFFQHLYPFDISSGFQSGINTLSFAVTNSNCFNTPPMTNPTGLLVDISGTVDLTGAVVAPLGSLPEPGTLFCTALGLVFFIYRVTQRDRSGAHHTPRSQGILGS